MTKKLGILFFLAIALLFSAPKSAILAHDGEPHPTRKVYVCDSHRVTFFRYYFVKFFRHNNFWNCNSYEIDVEPYKSPLASVEPTNGSSPAPTQSTPTPLSKTPTPSPKISFQPTSTTQPQPTTTVSNGSQPSQYWHEPKSHDGLNVHEHGDKPPSWADDFSKENFGHPVMFGGDEATPNENMLKHQAYKGFLMTASGVSLFIRYHSMSAPTDRMGPLHSYEVYAKDGSNNISFWQGWIFHGYPEQRSQRMPRHGEEGGFDPFYNITWPGRGQFIIAGSDIHDWADYKRCEQWYGHAGLWSWDISITICGATTYYTPDEHKGDVYNQSTWHLTGDKGGSRRLEVSHYGPQNPLVGGENLPFDKWFCVKKQPNENRSTGRTPTWDIGSVVSGPTSCQDGWLPQYVSSTFPKKGVYFQTGNTAEKDFPVQGVSIPN